MTSVTAPARMSMVFPGSWANIPLDDDRSMESTIAQLVKRQVGRDDRFAQLRRDAKQRLLAVARDAQESNAVQLALSLEILPGVPFPAAVVADYRNWPDPAGAGEQTVAQRLATVLPGGELLELSSGVAIRSFRTTTIRQGTEAVPDIKLEYFLCVPDGRSLLHVVADVPIKIEAELIAALFDAMVDSIRWFPAADDTEADGTAADTSR